MRVCIALVAKVVLIHILLIQQTVPAFTGSDNIKTIFKETQIVGDILDAAPTSTLFVKIGCVTLFPGQVLTPNQTKNQPEIIRWRSKRAVMYTLLLLDPDAPSRTNPQFRSVAHWMVTNIPADGKHRGDTNVAYTSPAPPKDTGLHRYIFLVFEQLGGRIEVPPLTFTEFLGVNYVFGFSLREFIGTYNLSNKPVAGNFFQAQNQDQN